VVVAVVCVMLWSLNSFQGAQVQPFDLRKCQQVGNYENFAHDVICFGLAAVKTTR
jgi:hypothetical protein